MSARADILMVDDDPDFVQAIRALLEGHGYQVRWAADGDEALRQARLSRPSLILLDVMMRERTEGFFLLQEIRRLQDLRDIPVIVLSSIYADCPSFRVQPEADWLPANLFLPKPVDPAKLLDEVARLVGTPSQENDR